MVYFSFQQRALCFIFAAGSTCGCDQARKMTLVILLHRIESLTGFFNKAQSKTLWLMILSRGGFGRPVSSQPHVLGFSDGQIQNTATRDGKLLPNDRSNILSRDPMLIELMPSFNTFHGCPNDHCGTADDCTVEDKKHRLDNTGSLQCDLWCTRTRKRLPRMTIWCSRILYPWYSYHSHRKSFTSTSHWSVYFGWVWLADDGKRWW